ncbi:kazrin isoform X3 [Hermetia illucens]|uniref:kazrin isoform X3 n=1 Tax=Hermetia illucens TaxID=343691 RepID=UPI0018CC6F7F|nr:kazrin isoform X3 [Hermetia illucens]
MQLNGTSGPTMAAASEPPEPPPRNPDRINASLNKLGESKVTKSLDTNDSRAVNNNKPLKPLLSLDNNITATTAANLTAAPSNTSSTATIVTTISTTFDNNQKLVSQSNASQRVEGQSAELTNGTSLGDAIIVKGVSSSHNSHNNINTDYVAKLRSENEKLAAEISRLRKLLENSPDGAVGGIDLSDSNSYDAHSTDGSSSRVDRLEAELKVAKNQIATLRAERKKLKSDKSELVTQVKQLCGSLQDKEQELRDFIRNFEQRIRETETNNAKISSERERERWSLLKHARDEAERSLALAQQLSARDIQLQRTQEQLQEARRQLSGCLSDQESLLSFAPLTPPSGLISHMAGTSSGIGGFSGGPGDRGSCSADSGVRGSSDRESTTGELNLSDGGPCENGPCITVDPDSISLVSSQHMYQFGTPKERSPTLSPLNSGAYSRSVEQLGSPVDSEPSALTRKFASKPNAGTLGTRSGRGGTWGSISRVFARSRNKNKTAPQDSEITDFTWSPLSEEGYAEKLRLLREASTIPMERWRASQVLAWLEVALGMPQYSVRCSENVKSGKVLLELNDTELETGLGLTHPMHRKKLRLAIEEQRRPDLVRYPTIGQLSHTWVASEWLPDIGLPQYAESFLHSLVDARMLDTLSKKELEKFLGVTRKFHQASIVHGIHVLRIVKYDRQTLAMRRLQSENVDTDPIVWTNQRFIRWARSIDLGEYADNLKDSGVHGGLVVLEPSFSGDTMATALGIPPSKNIIRRHLATEFDALILPARATLGQGIRSGCGVVPITGPGGLQQHYTTSDRRSSGSLRISAWKGSQSSLSKALRFHTKSRADKSLGNSTSPTPSYSSSEGGIYATIGPLPLLPPPTTAPPQPPPPSHRVSAPPMADSSTASLPRYAQHRRVKSISDIEVVAATPV